MSAFETNFANAARPSLLTVFGAAVTYRVASTDTSSAVTADVHPTNDFGSEDVFARFVISQADVASPVRGDQITHDSTVYTIGDAQDDQAGCWILRATAAQGIA